MGRRSDFIRRPQDAYDTPQAAVSPLLPYLPDGTRFCEPCAGAGALRGHLEAAGHVCLGACDLVPRADGITPLDALDLEPEDMLDVQYIITNPPWYRPVLHPLITHLRCLRPTWLLIDAPWMHTHAAAPYMAYCSHIVSIGRVRWIPDTTMTSKDDAAWYRFEAEPSSTIFTTRQDSLERGALNLALGVLGL